MLSIKTGNPLNAISSVLSYVGIGGGQAVKVPNVPVHDVDTLSDKRGRRLKHLLKLNHANYSILYSQRRFHNHSPHLLGSAYLLNGSADHLNEIWEDIATNDNLEAWEDSPGEIALHDYRDYLGKKEYQRAWVDFFEDQLVEHNFFWSEVTNKFLFESGPRNSPNAHPMFHCLTSGLGHPLIHLGYAYELNSREVAMEALGLAATCYDPKLASLLTASHPPSKTPTSSVIDLFQRIHTDASLPTFPHPGGNNLSTLLSTPEHLNTILTHFNALTISNPTTTFTSTQHLASLLLISTAPSLGGHGYDFFLVHLLTSSHAIRILLPFFAPKHHVALIREWVLIALLIYVAQNRPNLEVQKEVHAFDTGKKGWDDVTRSALEGEYRLDAHFVKACRALKVAGETWGDGDGWFLKCAVKFVEEFEGWGGFGGKGSEEEHGGGH